MMGSDRPFEPFIGNEQFSAIEGADFYIGQVRSSLALRPGIDVSGLEPAERHAEYARSDARVLKKMQHLVAICIGSANLEPLSWRRLGAPSRQGVPTCPAAAIGRCFAM
jgi:hypothetical protein